VLAIIGGEKFFPVLAVCHRVAARQPVTCGWSEHRQQRFLVQPTNGRSERAGSLFGSGIGLLLQGTTRRRRGLRGGHRRRRSDQAGDRERLHHALELHRLLLH
jgi:hypothetical protein